MKKFSIFMTLGALPVMASAASIQHQVDGSYTNQDPGSNDIFSATYTYYLDALETEGAIRNELAFVRRAEFARATVFDWEGDNYGSLGGRFFLNEDVFIGADYAFDMGGDVDVNALSARAGMYYSENSAAYVEASRDMENDFTGLNVGMRSVMSMGGESSLAYGAEFGAGDVSEFSDTLYVAANGTYYFTDFTGVGLALNYVEDADFLGYQFTANHYFSDTIGLIVSAGETLEDQENITATLRARF
jgi:hypothetical protein